MGTNMNMQGRLCACRYQHAFFHCMVLCRCLKPPSKLPQCMQDRSCKLPGAAYGEQASPKHCANS